MKLVSVPASPIGKKRSKSTKIDKKFVQDSFRLPKYVVIKNGDWYVKREFPTGERRASGAPVYRQYTQKCEPQTEERVREILFSLEMRHHTPAPEPSKLFTDVIENVLAAKRLAVTGATYDHYRALGHNYFCKSPLANKNIGDITTLHLQNYYATVKLPKTVRKLNMFASMVFRLAIKWDMAVRNPAKDVLLPRVERREIGVLDQKTARKFIDYCLSRPEYNIFALALETGMRPGEYLALRWSEIEGDRLNISRSVSFNRKGGGYVFKEAKTRSGRRTIKISPILVETLERIRSVRDKRIRELTAAIERPLVVAPPAGKSRPVLGVNYRNRITAQENAKRHLANFTRLDLVFPSKYGTPTPVHNLDTRVLRKVCKELRIPRITLYTLRHTSLTLLLSAGVDIKTIATRAGHSTPNILLQHYAHVLPSMEQAGIDKLAGVLYETNEAVHKGDE